MRMAASWLLTTMLVISGVAHADPATLTRLSTGSNNGEANAFMIASGNWDYDPATQTLTLNGNQEALFRVGTTPLYTTSLDDAVINLGAGTATASAYECIEGIFGGIVGASICGNYNLGANGINDSTLDYSTIPGTKTLGGDDTNVGPQQQLTDFPSNLGDCTGTTLIVNSSDWAGATPSDGNSTSGVQAEFTVASCVAAPPMVAVPNVVGQDQAAATTAITGAGLVVGTVTPQADATPAGQVISQDPAAATMVAPASAVNLVVSSGPATVSVPDVVGQDQAAATTAITGAGLVVGTVTPQADANAPAGSVISQDPAGAAMVAPASAVNLVVSSGPPVSGPTMLDLVRVTVGSGNGSADLNFDASTATWEYDAPAGDLTGTLTSAGFYSGSASVGTTPLYTTEINDLVVAAGVASATDYTCIEGIFGGIVGANICGNYSFGANAMDDSTTTWGPGTAVSQTINPDDVSSGAPQDITGYNLIPVSWDGTTLVLETADWTAAPETTGLQMELAAASMVQVDVPDVTGQVQADAEAAIVAANLVVGTVTQQVDAVVPAGSVISQNPVACTACADAGSAVDLVVSSGAALVDVPDVVGQTEADAGTAITGAGLVVGTVTQSASDTVAAGSVISQNPAACTACVAGGSAVDLEVSTGPAIPPGAIDVPDVVGQTQSQATQAIAAAGLTVGTVNSVVSNDVPAGVVVDQSPAGCEECAAPGSAVNLDVSSGPNSLPGGGTAMSPLGLGALLMLGWLRRRVRR